MTGLFTVGLLSGVQSVASLVSALAALAFVLLAAWFLLKWLGGASLARRSTRQIQVLDQVGLGPDKQLLLVRVGDHTMLVGMTAHAIEKLCEVDPDTLLPEQPVQQQSFSAILQNLRKGTGKGNGE